MVASPIHKRRLECGGDGLWLLVGESEDTLNDRELCTGGVQTAEGTPVIHHHACRQHVTASVDCTCLGRGQRGEDL